MDERTALEESIEKAIAHEDVTAESAIRALEQVKRKLECLSLQTSSAKLLDQLRNTRMCCGRIRRT